MDPILSFFGLLLEINPRSAFEFALVLAVISLWTERRRERREHLQDLRAVADAKVADREIFREAHRLVEDSDSNGEDSDPEAP